MRVLSINEAMDNTLIRDVPLNVAIPSDFTYFANEPYFGNHLWTTQRNNEVLQRTGSTDRTEGMIQVRISTDIGYDRSTNSFICGPDCNEQVIAEKFTGSGYTILENERRDVHGVPIWTLRIRAEAEPQFDAYMVYIGTLIETNAIVFTWGPPQGSSGEAEWAIIKRAMFETRGDPVFEALSRQTTASEGPPRRTPPIGIMTRLPTPTARVESLVDEARKAAAELSFKIDESGIAKGTIHIIATTDAGTVTLAMRFLDFGDEILVASSAHASGEAALKIQEVQGSFFNAFFNRLERDLPLVIMDDMNEMLVVLPPRLSQ